MWPVLSRRRLQQSGRRARREGRQIQPTDQQTDSNKPHQPTARCWWSASLWAATWRRASRPRTRTWWPASSSRGAPTTRRRSSGRRWGGGLIADCMRMRAVCLLCVEATMQKGCFPSTRSPPICTPIPGAHPPPTRFADGVYAACSYKTKSGFITGCVGARAGPGRCTRLVDRHWKIHPAEADRRPTNLPSDPSNPPTHPPQHLWPLCRRRDGRGVAAAGRGRVRLVGRQLAGAWV